MHARVQIPPLFPHKHPWKAGASDFRFRVQIVIRLSSIWERVFGFCNMLKRASSVLSLIPILGKKKKKKEKVPCDSVLSKLVSTLEIGEGDEQILNTLRGHSACW